MNYLLDIYDNLVSYFQSTGFANTILWIKVASSIVCTVLLVSIVVLLSRSRATWWLSEGIDSFRKPNLPQRMEHDWQRIKDRMEKEDEANLKLAVIEADNLLEDVLKRMGIEGRDLGERLEKLTTQQLHALDDVQDAHRLRDLIVHQSNAIVIKYQVESAVRAYEAALKELEMI
ncbi:MAG: hypothetical protein V1845_00330 [bacterium]